MPGPETTRRRRRPAVPRPAFTEQELAEWREYVIATRIAAGLPPTVTDPAMLDRLARLAGPPPPLVTARRVRGTRHQPPGPPDADAEPGPEGTGRPGRPA